MVSHRYCALNEKTVACIAMGSSTNMRDMTFLLVGGTEEVNTGLSTGMFAFGRLDHDFQLGTAVPPRFVVGSLSCRPRSQVRRTKPTF